MNEKIGLKTLRKVSDAVHDLLASYTASLNKAYLDSDELAVNIGLKFRPHKDGVMVNYQINYVESRVKDGDMMVINENQQDLPFGGKDG